MLRAQSHPLQWAQLHTTPANFPPVSLAPDKPPPSPPLGLWKARREAGGGGQRVLLFLKHIWESFIKKGGKGPQNMKKRHSFFKWGSLSRSHSGRKALPRSNLPPTSSIELYDESANAPARNLVHSGCRTQRLHPAQGCSLSPDLCQTASYLENTAKPPTCQPSETPLDGGDEEKAVGGQG